MLQWVNDQLMYNDQLMFNEQFVISHWKIGHWDLIRN